ncbi:hypothetical protein [Ruminococcus sp.]|uniref:DUF7768 domain-containing protein n=1 Tax=Ruminococcus sp. TaxID=41978 RepID=UPI003992092D
MANLYNSEGYFSPTEYEAMTRIEKEEKAARKAANFRPIVYICSPYAGNIEQNTENAKKYSRFAVDNHCLPITPHIYFTQFMNDEDERAEAVLMNNILLSHCCELWVFGDVISKGMSEEIKQAKRKYMKIRYFTEEMEEKMRISEIIAGLMSLRKDTESHIGPDDDFNDVFYHDIKVLDAVIAELRKRNAASPVRKNITTVVPLALCAEMQTSARKRTSCTARNATVFLRRRKTNEIYALHR